MIAYLHFCLSFPAPYVLASSPNPLSLWVSGQSLHGGVTGGHPGGGGGVGVGGGADPTPVFAQEM